MSGLRGRTGRRSAFAGVAVALALGLAPLTASPAVASPLDPGFTASESANPFYQGTFCSAPGTVAGRPGWSRVVCGVGADEFVVPLGIHVLEVDVRGAGGGAGGGGAPGGGGAQIGASIMVGPGQLLEMAVGGAGGSGEVGGFNGGGDGPHSGAAGLQSSGGGGGSSDIRVGDAGPWQRILSAAGGGGGGGSGGGAGPLRRGGSGGASSTAGHAGAGGTAAGAGGFAATSAGSGAGGGTGPSAGGAGSTETLVGGAGGAGQPATAASSGDGGGGGGGYGFGGGGAGGSGGAGGGGGGGSNFVNPLFLSPGIPVTHADGVNHRDGRIVIVYHAPPVFCGSTIYASMTLRQDLDCRGKPGLVIGGQRNPGYYAYNNKGPVVFDLNGHTILGDNTLPSGFFGGDVGHAGIEIDRLGVTIRNGTIKGFGVAVFPRSLSRPNFHPELANATISNMTLTDGAVGVGASLATIDHNRISKMSQAAILLGTFGSSVPGGAIVTDNTITDSAAGVVFDGVFDPLTISGNVIRHNAGFGISGPLLLDTTITGNIATDNQAGIAVSTSAAISPDCLISSCGGLTVSISDNTVARNASAGIVWTGAAIPDSQVARNVADRNGTSGNSTNSGDGIQLDLTGNASNVTVTANQANHNVGYGIQATGVTDGGGNVATGNHGAAQCIGVACVAG